MKDITDILGPKDFFALTHMITRQGVKIGFIGFTSDIVELMHPLLAEGMDFAFGMEEHKNLLIQHARALRKQGVEIVVLMSELGIHKDIGLSKALAGMAASGKLEAGLLDVMFSAHTHEVTHTMVTQSANGSTLYAPVVESGHDGYLGRMDVTMRYKNSTTTRQGFGPGLTTEQNWGAIAKQWQILNVTSAVAEHAAVKKLVDTARAPFLVANPNIHALPFVMQTLKQPINTVISRNHSNESTFNNVFTQMMLDMSRDPKLNIADAKISISPAFRMGASLPEAGFLMENGAVASGDFTLEDAYRFFPMYYGMVTAQTTGAAIKRGIEFSLTHTYSSDPFNHSTGWPKAWGGVKQTLNLANGDPVDDSQLSRLVDLKYDSDVRVKDDELITVIGCRRLPIDYRGTVCGQPGFTNEVTVKTADGMMPESMADMFVNALKNGYKLRTSKAAADDQSHFPMFPNTPFIQPLEGTGGYIQPAPTEDPCGYFKWKCQPGQPF